MEAMVAISILSLSVTGPLVIAQKGIASAIYSRDQVTAFYLAQEAVEYFRNARDTNVNNEAGWLDSMSECQAPNFCTIDIRYPVTDANALVGYLSDNTPTLSIDKSVGVYGYDSTAGWTPTLFKRVISYAPIGTDDKEIVLSVKVSWTTTLFAPQKEFSVKEVLFNVSSI